jgi:hypothetical protein
MDEIKVKYRQTILTIAFFVIAILLHLLILLLILIFSGNSNTEKDIFHKETQKEKLIPILMDSPSSKTEQEQEPKKQQENIDSFELPKAKSKAGALNIDGNTQKAEIKDFELKIKEENKEELAQNEDIPEQENLIQNEESLNNTINNAIENINSDLLNQLKAFRQEKKIQKRRSIMGDPDLKRPIFPKEAMQGLMGLSPHGEYTFTYNSPNAINNPRSLKNASYVNKIFSFMQSAWFIKRNELKIRSNTRTTIGIFLTLDKNGQIINLSKTRSSGIQEIDDIVMATIKYAAPYPPIPDHLNKDTFDFPATLEIFTTR